MTETVKWIAPDGLVYTLNVPWDVQDRYMPPIQFQSDPVPGQPGEYFREVEFGVHEFVLPFDVIGTSEADLRSQIRVAMSALNPKRGVGKLRVTSPIGDEREINCRVSAGLGLSEALGEHSGPTWQRFPASFIAHDPFWYDVSPTTKNFTITSTPNFFPLFPVRLVASQIVAYETVTNTGDEEAWPIWTITGPGSVVKLSNLTTGKVIYFPNLSLTSGQRMYIDTRPGYKTVTYDDGSSAYTSMSTSPLSELWSLDLGANVIQLEMSGSTVASSLSMQYTRRYLSP